MSKISDVKKIENELAKKSRLEFLFSSHNQGIPLSEEEKIELEKAGLIDNKAYNFQKRKKGTEVPFDQAGGHNITKKGPNKKDRGIEYLHSGKEILTKEWKPKDKIAHSTDFVRFINTMNNTGFQNKAHYEPLKLYVQQCHNWLSEKKRMEDCTTTEEEWEFFNEEFQRCKEG